ncbi:hypothetical protein CBL_00240 [Carabus blaptoides fortunei]
MATDNNKGGKTKWTSHNTSRLISVYKELKAKVNQTDVRLWEYVQREMDSSGYLFTISECKMKWRQLWNTYQENKGKKSTWSHYKEMDEIYKKDETSNTNKNKITYYFKSKKTTPGPQ